MEYPSFFRFSGASKNGIVVGWVSLRGPHCPRCPDPTGQLHRLRSRCRLQVLLAGKGNLRIYPISVSRSARRPVQQRIWLNLQGSEHGVRRRRIDLIFRIRRTRDLTR